MNKQRYPPTKQDYIDNGLTITEDEICSQTTSGLDRLRKYDGTIFDPIDGIMRIWNGKLIVEPNDERSDATMLNSSKPS